MAKMRRRLLGGTGLRVAELSLGTMTFAQEEWGTLDRGVAQAMFDAYVDAGATSSTPPTALRWGSPSAGWARWCVPTVSASLSPASTGSTVSGTLAQATRTHDNLAALDLRLTADQAARLDTAGAIRHGFPYDMIRRHDFMFGEAADVDPPRQPRR
jgi:hypothetical protein